jgi:SAM-dependent MidA family methyltransferase
VAAGGPRPPVPDTPRQPGGDGALAVAITRHVAEVGPIGFDEYVAHALYTPGLGFYQRGGGAGRRRDFITSPEVGPLFGAVIAHALDTWWAELGQPATLSLVEAGAGPGTLARAIVAAEPRCAEALRITLVEPGTVQWGSHPEGVTSRVDMPRAADLPRGPVVVLANELLDNLPFAVAELTDDGWAEVRVGVGADGTSLVEVLHRLDGPRADWCRRMAPRAEPGARIPVQNHAADWLARALALVEDGGRGGRVVVFDYASTTAEMAERRPAGWLRTYAAHDTGHDPLDSPGSCDITTEVAVDQLAIVRQPDLDQSQAGFLRSHGIDDLVAEGRDRWEQEGISGGLAAIAGRSRVHEAEALTDPAGLGAFRVLQWVVTVSGRG